MRYLINYCCISHKGKVRKQNQDNFFCKGIILDQDATQNYFPISGQSSPGKKPIFAVFDGMGGERCGDVASRIAAEYIQKTKRTASPYKFLIKFCNDANSAICDFAVTNNIGVMGTTAAVLTFTNKEAWLCNIGDSKIFSYIDGEICQQSKDHLAICAYGRKPPLLQYLGLPPEESIIDPYITKIPLSYDATYLITSDGLTDLLSNAEIADILSTQDITNASETLLEQVLDRGGHDNTTFILLKIIKKPGWFSSRCQHPTE